MKRAESTPHDASMKKQKKWFYPSSKIISRIHEYLDENSHLKVIDLDCMTAYLQDTYREYARKKQSAFRIHVQRVCDSLNLLPKCSSTPREIKMRSSEQQNKTSNESFSDSDVILATSSEESFSEDNENYVTYENTNLMNRSLTSMYKNGPSCQDSSEVASYIDISDGEAKGDKSIDLVTPKSIKYSENYKSTKPSTSNLSRNIKKKSENLTEKIEQAIKNKLEKNLEQSTVRLKDIGGYETTIQDVIKLLIHLKHSVVHETLGVAPPRGFLLHGPPGCGKTLLVYAIAGELGLPFIKVAATEMVSGVSGESEERLRELFNRAISASPCILFIDEIDAITPKRETAQKEMERRIVAQLLTCLDDLTMKENAQVLVIGATNRPDSLDPALRRAGRFDREIKMGIPDESSRIKILEVLCRKLKLKPGFNLQNLARQTPGFVGADLQALTREAAMIAVDRILNFEKEKHDLKETTETPLPSQTVSSTDAVSSVLIIDKTPSPRTDIENSLSWLQDQPPLTSEQLENLYIDMSDFEQALKVVQPSAMREGFATIPGVTWNDIGALTDIRQELQMAILAPVKHPELFATLNITAPPGILLCGPPGCGKTLLAKAIANESGVNFISVKGPELLNMYVGESERAVRQVFQRAQNSAPCVIFFDELDALCPNRINSAENGASVRVVNQMLTEMDGLETRKKVFIIGATNRPDIIDPAMLRPGRLDKILYVGLPTPENRIDILKALTKNGTKPLMAKDVQLNKIASDNRCDGFSGADLASLVQEASVIALKKFIDQPTTPVNICVFLEDFEKAFSKVKPSVSTKTVEMFETMKIRRSN